MLQVLEGLEALNRVLMVIWNISNGTGTVICWLIPLGTTVAGEVDPHERQSPALFTLRRWRSSLIARRFMQLP